MTFGSHQPGYHDGDDDVPLAEEVARRVALALDHAQSLAEARAARLASEAARAELEIAVVHARLLADISGSLESSLELAPALDGVAELLVERLADAVVIDVVDLDGHTSCAGRAERTPGALADLERAGRPGAQTLTVPLIRSGRGLGALTLLRAPGQRSEKGELPLLEEIARRVALAIDAALLYADRAATARTLQASLLPEHLPTVPGMDLAVRYLPASGAAIGGDFYDVFELGDGTSMLVVGDVCGKGVEAAALTAQARYTIRALAPSLLEPTAVLAALNTALRQQREDGRFVTVAAVRIDPRTGATEVACAGHPPPILLRRSGESTVVPATGAVAGIFEDIGLCGASASLGAGDVLAIFTDGVTEACREEVRGSADLLREVDGASPGGPEAVAAALERVAQRSASGPLRDDVAILAVALSSA